MRVPVTVVASTFEDLVAIGLRQIISEDTNLHLISDGIPLDELEAAIKEHEPSVVLLNFGSLPHPAAAAGPADRLELAEPDLLTAREADVLELLQQGYTNAAIAHELSIGVETVRTHARNIYRKLGISTRRDLARLSRPDSGP